MIRLLLADDEDLIRGALAALLEFEDDLDVIAQASTSDSSLTPDGAELRDLPFCAS